MNVLIPGFAILFSFAIFWEYRDYQRVRKRPCINGAFKRENEKEKLYIHYSSFPYENCVVWRKNLLLSFLCGSIIYLILRKAGFKYLKSPGLMILFISIPIFLIFHIGEGIKHSTLYKEIYGKVNEKYIPEKKV